MWFHHYQSLLYLKPSSVYKENVIKTLYSTIKQTNAVKFNVSPVNDALQSLKIGKSPELDHLLLAEHFKHADLTHSGLLCMVFNVNILYMDIIYLFVL